MRILIVAWVFLLASCQIDKDKKINRDKFSFKTGDDTEIFFKNMRQSYYGIEENKQANFNLFRFKETPDIKDVPQVKPVIVINYLQDEAYIMLETNSFFKDYQPMHFQWQDSTQSTGDISLEAYNREAILEFSTQLYESIIKNHQLSTEINGKQYKIFVDRKEREAFRVTLSDYYRLTRIF